MKHGILNQKHPEYDDVLWSELDTLYEGGYRAMRRAGDFLQRLDGEKENRYRDRLRLVSYIGYMGQIIDFFCASLFQAGVDVTEAVDADDPVTPGKPPIPDDYWQEFSDDADLQRTPFSTVLRNAVRDALLKRRALIMCDFPTADNLPASRAEEKAMGLDRGYIYDVPLEQLIDWDVDDYGCFTWCILYEQTVERSSPGEVRGAVRHTWTVWSMMTPEDAAKEVIQFAQGNNTAPYRTNVKAKTDASAKARWDKYEVVVPLNFDGFKPDTNIPRVDGDVTTFNRIPLLLLEIPAGLWAGNFLGPMAREHWARRSYLVGAEARNMTAVGYVELATGPGADSAGVMMEPADKRALHNRGIDLALPGRVAYAEPQASAYTAVDKQLTDLKDEMFRVAHQMAMSVDNSSSTMRRSGQSKQQDKKDIATVLGALAGYAKDFAVLIYKTLAQPRGETDVEWTPRGLDQFVDDDRQQLLQEAVQIDLINIPSPTFKKEYKAQLALKLTPNLSSATQDVIRNEIIEGVDNEQELDDLLMDNEKEAAQDTPTPGEVHADNTKVAMTAAKNPAPVVAGGPAGKPGAKKPANGKPASA